MPELDDLGSLVPLAAADLSSADRVPVYHAATRSVREVPATDLGGSVTVLTRTAAEGSPLNNAIASLTTALTGDDNDLVFTAVSTGGGGNDITIEYNADTPSVALSVSVTGTNILVILAEDGGITSTAAEVLAAIEASEAASALVTVAAPPELSTAGVVTAMAATPLSGGVTATPADFVGQSLRVGDASPFDWWLWDGTAWVQAAVALSPMLTLFGVPTYADLTAANTALAIGSIFYNTALAKLDITTA